MKIRAYVYDRFIFSEDFGNGLYNLTKFFQHLLKQEINGESIKLDRCSNIKDCEQRMIYERDMIAVFYREKKRKTYEICKVEFEDGCFVAVNEDGFHSPLSECVFDEDHYLKIIGSYYKESELETKTSEV